MTTLTADVGPKGSNLSHDVTLVQAMLQAIVRPSGPRYYDAKYDGIYGPLTAAAIEAFQTDRGISGAEFGTVNMTTTTWKLLLQALPADRQGMRIMMGTSIVYLAASQALFSTGQATVAASKFQSSFAPRVGNLIRDMYQTYEIALKVGNDGGYRTFQGQANIRKNTGPGESLHNFGFAADVLFNSLTLIEPNGVLKDGGRDGTLPNLKALKLSTWKAFWDARNRIAQGYGLFGIGDLDRPHLKTPATVRLGRSLAAHLNSRGKMKWDVRGGRPNVYKTDLGGGGMLVEVGTAAQIWRGQANLTTHTIGKALGIPATQVGSGDINKFRRALHDEFRWAESNWRRWQPK